jgi:hypothetical protein
MRKVSFGTSWQSKASMLPLSILIAQRLQIETLRGRRRAYKSCRKIQQRLQIALTAYGQREVHSGGPVCFDRSRHVEQRKGYFLP